MTTEAQGKPLSVLFEPGWHHFVQEKWGLEPLEIFAGSDTETQSAFLRLQTFTDKAGRFRNPPRQPYYPADFRLTPSPAPQKRERNWLELTEDVVRQMATSGLGGAISLDPSITDVRAWQWAGMRSEVRYTYLISLPYSLADASNSVRKNIRKADRLGYSSERTNDIEAVVRCLSETETRQGFSYGIGASDIHRLVELISPETCRLYLCRNQAGEAVSSRVVLHKPRTTAIDWIAGTRSDDLNNGVTQQLIAFILQDLTNAGAESLDYGGANISSIARSKLEWGGTLTRFYAIRPRSFKTITQDTLAFVRELGKKWYRFRS